MIPIVHYQRKFIVTQSLVPSVSLSVENKHLIFMITPISKRTTHPRFIKQDCSCCSTSSLGSVLHLYHWIWFLFMVLLHNVFRIAVLSMEREQTCTKGIWWGLYTVDDCEPSLLDTGATGFHRKSAVGRVTGALSLSFQIHVDVTVDILYIYMLYTYMQRCSYFKNVCNTFDYIAKIAAQRGRSRMNYSR